MLRIKAFFLIVTLALTSGCAVKPWVLSQERGILAEPIMAFEKHPVSTRYINHVYEAREAGRGAEGSAGGGCGCN